MGTKTKLHRLDQAMLNVVISHANCAGQANLNSRWLSNRVTPTGGEGRPTGCSLKTQLVDHLTNHQQGYTWSEDSDD